MVEYKTDIGLVFTDIDTKYYYQKRSEEKDFNIEVKGVLNTTFSEFTITMFSKIYDSYTRTYRKAPDLLADVGGVLNILYIIAKVMNFYIETKLKEADIFNICCSDSIENRKKNSSSVKIKTKTLELEYKDSRNENNNLILNNHNNLIPINSMNSNRVVGDKILDLDGDEKFKGSPLSCREPNDIIKLNYDLKRDNQMIEKPEFTRFKSIILDKTDSLETLLKVDYDIFEILFPCRRTFVQREKMDLAEKFCDQLFDVHFIFGNVLDTQVNFKKIFEKNISIS
jgi:hypothetical protein